ncbi:MAG: hypothetical protein IKO89_07420 [Bacteroidales bacterium]|jgi:uncharacterized protein (TIGR02145 family)|nr:hypothetical protein [Bacteroidales bacterium]
MKNSTLLLCTVALLVCGGRAFAQIALIPHAVTDIDGNTYNAVQIGTQVWTAENMRAKRDCEGNELYTYCPDNNPKNVAKYGYLYTWPEAKKVCPAGWHLPTNEEWKQLKKYVMSQKQYVCGDDSTNIAKALASQSGWKSCESSYEWDICNKPGSNNATGFNALPAGDIEGHFGIYARFWTAGDSYGTVIYRSLYYGAGEEYGYYYVSYNAFSVRCVKD